MSRQDSEYARQRLYVDSSGWSRPDEAIPHLATLQDAVWRGRRLRFTYERGAGGVEREGDPLGLVVKGSVWYLVAGIEGGPADGDGAVPVPGRVVTLWRPYAR